MADGVDFVKTIECVIFIVSFMIWGGFLVFMVAAYKIRKLTQELQELRMESLSHNKMVDKIVSMFRDVNYTIGYDPNTPIGRIAKVARLHWFKIQSLQEPAKWKQGGK